MDKHLTKLQVFGDSQLIINWVFGKYRIQNIQLAQILHEVNRFVDMLESVGYKHIYRERNSLANVLAKDGSNVQVGYWKITEHWDVDSFVTVLAF